MMFVDLDILPSEKELLHMKNDVDDCLPYDK